MKRWVLLIGVLVGLIALGGCQLLPTAQVGPLRMNARGRTYGTSLTLRPIEEEGGVAVTFIVDKATSDCEINYGDGQTGILTNGHGSHVYTQGGEYPVRVVCRGRVMAATVRVLNSAPEAYPGMISPSTCQWMERQVVDLRYRVHGCHKEDGSPETVSGARSLDGDELEYLLEVTGPDGQGNTVEYTVFDLDRHKVNGEWTKGGLLVVFVGWNKDKPPYPFFVNPQAVSESVLEPKCPVAPNPPVTPPMKTLGEATFTYTVRDQWGGVGTASWKESVTSSSCTGG